MKVLWITNVELPDIAEYFGREMVICGWLKQMAIQIADTSDIELYIGCRQDRNEFHDIQIRKIHYFSFNSYHGKNDLIKIFDAVQPELIHIWGTEYKHTYEAMLVAQQKGLLDRTVISIQGLVSVCCMHYATGLPEKIISHRTLVEFLGRGIYFNLADDRRYMQKRGITEVSALRMAKSCIGRTDWDHACVKQINPDIKYYMCNETLRDSFYHKEWKPEECRKHSIFFSQAHYPIKGFHFMIEALPAIRKVFPDVRVYVLGEDIFHPVGIKNKIKKRSYQQYLCKKIKRYGLQDCIQWMGQLSEEQMAEQYYLANVYVCASTIENSSNSIGEAMLTGVPVVASDVGGVKSLLQHDKEGLIYQETAPYMLADCVIRIFSDDGLAVRLGENARLRARVTHDREHNLKTLLGIYKEISK